MVNWSTASLLLLGCTRTEPAAPSELPPLPPSAIITPDPAPVRPDIADADFFLTNEMGTQLDGIVPVTSQFVVEFHWRLVGPESFKNRPMSVYLVKRQRNGGRVIAASGRSRAKPEPDGRYSVSITLMSPPLTGEFFLIAFYDWEYVLAEKEISIVPAADSK